MHEKRNFLMGKDIKRTTLGKKLLKLRTDQGLTQGQVAEKLKMKQNTYGRYERGTTPKKEMLINLAKLFGVSIDYLLSEEDENLKDIEYVQTEMRGTVLKFLASNKDVYNIVEDDLGKLSETEILMIKNFRELSDEDKLFIIRYFKSKNENGEN